MVNGTKTIPLKVQPALLQPSLGGIWSWEGLISLFLRPLLQALPQPVRTRQKLSLGRVFCIMITNYDRKSELDLL